MQRRQLIHRAASVAVVGLLPRLARPQDGRLLRVVIPYGPGGNTDVVTRMIAPSMSRTLGRTVVIDNRPGAAGLIATRLLQNPPNDGSTILMVQNIGFVGLPYTQKTANYDPVKDFVPVAGIADGPGCIYAHGSVPARNIAEFIAYAKTVPGGIESATSGPGGGSHMWTVLLAKRAGINLLSVPYKSGAEMATSLISGETKIMITNGSEPLNAQVRAGKLRMLGVTSERPSSLTPGVPVIADTVPGYVIEGWYGLIGPAGLPAAEAASISAAVHAALMEPGIKEKYAALFMEPRPMTPQEFAIAIGKTNAFYRRLVADLGLTPQ